MISELKKLVFKPLSHFGISSSIQATAIWSMLESFANPFFTLMLIPILIKTLGLEKYGIYVIVTAFLNLFSFTSLGISTSIIYYLASQSQNQPLKNQSEKIGNALLISIFGTCAFSLILISGYWLFMPTINKLFPQLLTYQNLIFITLLLLITTQIDVVLTAALKGLRVFEISSKLEFFIRVVNFLVLAIVTFVLKNLTVIVISALLLSILNIILRYKKLAKLVNFNYKYIRLNKEFTLELLHFGKWMTLQNVSGAIFGALDKIVLGYVTNTSTVGIYNVLVSIAQLSHYFLANASSFLLPKIAENSANIANLKNKYKQSLVISGSITIVILISTALLYPIISQYLQFNLVGNEFFILLFAYALLAMCVPPYYFALGMGKVKILSNINTLSALVGILAIIFLVAKFGMLGAATSRLIYTLFVMLTFLIPAHLFRKIK